MEDSMPICSSCKQDKAASEFNPKNGRKQGFQSSCKVCQADYNKNWYKQKKATILKKVRARQQLIRDECRQNVLNYLKTHPCIDCGETNPIVLEFDHINPEEKTRSVANMIHSGCLWKTIEREIAKCEVRCANCHRKRTAKQFGWYAYLR